MITFILSDGTRDRFTRGQEPGVIGIPVRFLDFEGNFTNTSLHPTWHYEKELAPGEGVTVVRMPEQMYERLVSMRSGDTVPFPLSSFARQYDNLTDLEAHVVQNNRYVELPVVDTHEPLPPTVPRAIMTTESTPQPAPVPIIIIGLGIIAGAFLRQRL
jgi:hypothetical protein